MIDVPKGHLMVNYLGLRGAGKTLSAVHEEVLPRYLEGRKIVSTSFLNLKGVDIINTPKDCEKLRNCVLFIDELGDFVDAYDWANIPQSFRRFLRLSRKRKVDIITTAQDISYIAKPFRVLFSHWVFCENGSPRGLIGKFLRFSGLSYVRVVKEQLTANDLFTLQNGVGHNVLLDDDPSVPSASGSDLDSDDFNIVDEVSKVSKTLSLFYNNRKILRNDLDDKKLYLYSSYCPKCESIIDYIPSEKTSDLIGFNKKKKPFFKSKIFCPDHSDTLLIPKKMGIYDTDFEIPVPPVPGLIFKPYIPSPEGERFIPYRGILPSGQQPPKA